MLLTSKFFVYEMSAAIKPTETVAVEVVHVRQCFISPNHVFEDIVMLRRHDTFVKLAKQRLSTPTHFA